jgi:sn-2 palmitoyl-lipid 9-desaturase
MAPLTARRKRHDVLGQKEKVRRSPAGPPPAQPVRIHAGMAAGLIAFHLMALLAPWTFTWAGLVTAVVLFLLTGSLGIGLGYHRLLCHRSFHVKPWLRYPFALLGVLAFQHGPLTWCAIHRLHHCHADTPRDPQMSGRGILWAHVLWAVADRKDLVTEEMFLRLVRDLRGKRILCCIERNFYAANALFAVGLFLLGWLLGGACLGGSLLVWSFFLRVVIGWHVTFLVNSINHRWGYRNHASPDNSRNCWWVAVLSFGEGWHNNHHHWPRCAAHGHRWFDIDLNYELIRLLEMVGVADAVVHPCSEHQESKQVRSRDATTVAD